MHHPPALPFIQPNTLYLPAVLPDRTPKNCNRSSSDDMNTAVNATIPPSDWSTPCTHTECTLHQLSPYIGKLKSVIARDLITQYSKPGNLVADMFCGSGTVPLEAASLGRHVFASDISTYAVTLTKAKLQAPITLHAALTQLDNLLHHVQTLPLPDTHLVPAWVKAFFHPQTLKETLRLTELLRSEQRYFLLASTLGILHHQRPGFLSFPSSHLVPYLRSRNFPRDQYPELYEHRAVAPRLRAKVQRALSRPPITDLQSFVAPVHQSSIETLDLPDSIDCVITSPPYMNALDYGRDNRLRLWFLHEQSPDHLDHKLQNLDHFRHLMTTLALKLKPKLRPGGYCVVVVGERVTRTGNHLLSNTVLDVFATHAQHFRLCRLLHDIIPDIRRSRKNIAGVKSENILVFRKAP